MSDSSTLLILLIIVGIYALGMTLWNCYLLRDR